MGCSNSTQAKNVSAQKAKGTLLGTEAGADAAALKLNELKLAPLAVGAELDTPYGKGLLEELKQGDGVTYAVVKLSSGFVSVPQYTAEQWRPAQPAQAPGLLKLGNLEVGVAMETPYGPGTLQALKENVFDDEKVVLAMLKLTSGFVSVPAATAEAWMGPTATKADKLDFSTARPSLKAAGLYAAGATQEESKAPEQQPEHQPELELAQPVALSAEPAKEEKVFAEAPFPEGTVPMNLIVEPADLKAEIINADGGAFGCGKVSKGIAQCGCAEGFVKPQEMPVAA